MSRKHFQELADMVKAASDYLSDAQRSLLARDLCIFCLEQNDRFNKEKFLEACEVD